MTQMDYIRDISLHEECGVFGIFGTSNAAEMTYYGLHSMQHRGQEGCGIVTADSEGKLCCIKGEGLVHEVFDESKISRLKGSMAIGHVRYATTGAPSTFASIHITYFLLYSK